MERGDKEVTKTIALCGVSQEIACKLEDYSGCRLLYFGDEPEQRGDVKLAYFLRDDGSIDFAIVGYLGAMGLAACDYLRTQSSRLPILWLCDRKEFEMEASRLGVAFYGTGPPDLERLAAQLTLERH